MIRILTALVLLFAFSCSKKSEKDKSSNIDSMYIKAPEGQYVSVNQEFLNHFKKTEDTVRYFTAPENAVQPVRGSQWLQERYIDLYPANFKIGNPKKPEVYALEQFDADPERLALITQNFGEYSLTSVNLMLYDKKAEAVTDALELADEVADAGYSSSKKTILIKDNNTWRGLMWFTTSVGPSDEKDPTNPVKTSDYFSVKIANGKIDTAKAASAEIAKYKPYFK